MNQTQSSFSHLKPVELSPNPSAALQDTLAKFEGQTLKDCGEDLLVEISEILFNELAFFRLMQDLDNSSRGAKHKSKKPEERPSKTRQGVQVRLAWLRQKVKATPSLMFIRSSCEVECSSRG